MSDRFLTSHAIDDIVETNTPDEFLDRPQNERARQFLAQILH